MILLRHGQSLFNKAFTATRRDPGIPDPPLTEEGEAQARAAAEALVALNVRRIIASPYTRALQTASPLARRLALPVIINPIVRERTAFSCDIGTPRTELARAWPEHDFSNLDEIWWPAIEEPALSVLARAAVFRAEMAALDDWRQTVVVSHWGFILSVTGESVMNGRFVSCDPTQKAPDEVAWVH